MTIKEKLIQEINQIDDESLLNELHQLILAEIKSDSIYKLSPEEKNAIAEAREDLKNNLVHNHDDVKKQTAEWFKKK